MQTLRHLISVDDFERDHFDSIFGRASYYYDNLGKMEWDDLKRKRMLSIFCEPSTRTRFSFEAAMYELGGQVINAQDANVSSSFAKDETIEDAMQVLSSYGHIIVFRYNDKGEDRENSVMKRAAMAATVPLINAGDGPHEHPTQTLVDLFTIQQEHGRIDDLTIALAGDLCYGRTVHSLAIALGRYCRNIRMIFISPHQLSIPTKIKETLGSCGVQYAEYNHLSEAPLHDIDCLYMTRIQKERFDDLRDYEAVKGCCVLRPEFVEQMNEEASVLHPLPRIDEIPKSVDKRKQAKYFKQVRYGLAARMGLLYFMLKGQYIPA